ncbi:chromosome segregation protein SMC [Nitrospira sp. Kam-Ns4a]
MYLKSVELTGFKSFAEGRIEFPTGMTAIVGPNGVGKSNVVDAILWVLGEQSTKTLRSERMEDVIFNGTQTRKPLGMAEVSLTLSGVDGQKLAGLPGLPEGIGHFHEIMITRRLYRNGDSEYLINKTPCRLKDIRSLMLDTRAGSKGHTVIEQGRIEQILNASPQERRELIEETAGIVRYKKQKAEALRKLEATQQNLLRVRDIIAELRSRRSVLERQARQARTYRELQAEARTLEIQLLVRDYRGLLAAQAAVEGEIGALELGEAEHLASQARLTRDLEAARLKLASGGQTLERIREELNGVQQAQAQALTAAEVARSALRLYEAQRRQAQEDSVRLAVEGEQAEAAITGLRDRLSGVERELAEHARRLADLDQAAARLAVQHAAALQAEEQARAAILEAAVQVARGENALQALEASRQDVARRADRLDREQAEAEAQAVSLRAQLEDCRRRRLAVEKAFRTVREEREAAAAAVAAQEERVREADQLIGRQQEELAGIESRLRALQGVLREDMGYGRDGEEQATSLRVACPGVHAALAEWLVVPPGLERALEALLGERVRAWLVEEPGQARQAIEFLRTRALGRGAFVPRRPRWAAPAEHSPSQPWWPAVEGQPGVVGRVLDFVRGPAELEGLLAWLFGGAVIVESLEDALALWERGGWSAPAGPTLVTRDGEVVDPAGVVSGGTVGASGGLLQRRREIQELEAQRAERRDALGAQRAAREQAVAAREAAQARVVRLDETIRELELRELAERKDEQGLVERLARLDQRLETVRAERQMDEGERLRIEAEIEAGRAQQAMAVQERANREATLARCSQARAALEGDIQALTQRSTEARLAAASLEIQREHVRAELARLEREREDRVGRLEALRQQLATLVESMREREAERERSEALGLECGRRADALQAELVAAQEAQAREAEAARQVEEELDAARRALGADREVRTTLEVRRAEIRTQLGLLENALSGTYQLTVEAALAQVPEEPAPEAAAEAGGETGSETVRDPTAALKARLQKIRERLDRMGPINLAAIEEHQELETRYAFLTGQEQDLAHSIASLKEIISKINRTTKQLFLETFNELQEKFGEVFSRFFPGGRAELVLVEPEPPAEGEPKPADEPGVDIVAQPPGKRLKSITMLSGGEKTLTAMALIFASFLIRPSPFCILDEIDAPLDEENIGRFVSVLRELAEGVQFILITHNKRTMAVADSLFGVTMEEPGVSTLVSVRLADYQHA